MDWKLEEDVAIEDIKVGGDYGAPTLSAF